MTKPYNSVIAGAGTHLHGQHLDPSLAGWTLNSIAQRPIG